MAIPKGFGKTYIASDVVKILDLKYGRNHLYEYMVELGLIDINHKPTDSMIEDGLLAYQEPPITSVTKNKNQCVPIFSQKGIAFVDKLLKESGLTQKPKPKKRQEKFKPVWI